MVTYFGPIYELDYRRGPIRGWLGQRETLDGASTRACVEHDVLPQLTTPRLRALEECLRHNPTRDGILGVAEVDGALVLAPRERCSASEAHLCDAKSAYFGCASAVARVVARSVTPCWRQLTFVTSR